MELGSDALVGRAGALFAENQDVIPSTLPLPFVPNSQVGIELLHDSNSRSIQDLLPDGSSLCTTYHSLEPVPVPNAVRCGAHGWLSRAEPFFTVDQDQLS